MAITKDDIIQAAETLEQCGEKATMAAVRDFLKGGSFATISPVLREWKESRKSTQVAVLDMPGEMKSAAERMASEFWQTASKLANEKLEVVQAESGVAMADAQSERDEALQEVARLEGALTIAVRQKEEGEQQNQAMQEQYSQSQTEVVRLREQVAASQSENGRLRDDLKRMTTEKDRQADEASRLLGLNSELKRKETEHQQQCDELRQQAMTLKTTISGLEARVANQGDNMTQLQTENSELKQENKALIRETGSLQGQMKQLEQVVTRLKEKK